MATRKGDLTGSKGRQMRNVLNRQVLKAFRKTENYSYVCIRSLEGKRTCATSRFGTSD